MVGSPMPSSEDEAVTSYLIHLRAVEAFENFFSSFLFLDNEKSIFKVKMEPRFLEYIVTYDA